MLKINIVIAILSASALSAQVPIPPIFPARAVTDADMQLRTDTCVFRLTQQIGKTDTVLQVTSANACPTSNFLISNSTFVGYNTQALNATGDINENCFGYLCVGLGSNTAQIGNSSVTTLGVGGLAWYQGTGAPAINCAIGSLYSNLSGGASTTLYVCTATNTWTAK